MVADLQGERGPVYEAYRRQLARTPILSRPDAWLALSAVIPFFFLWPVPSLSYYVAFAGGYILVPLAVARYARTSLINHLRKKSLLELILTRMTVNDILTDFRRCFVRFGLPAHFSWSAVFTFLLLSITAQSGGRFVIPKLIVIGALCVGVAFWGWLNLVPASSLGIWLALDPMRAYWQFGRPALAAALAAMAVGFTIAVGSLVSALLGSFEAMVSFAILGVASWIYARRFYEHVTFNWHEWSDVEFEQRVRARIAGDTPPARF